MKVNELLEQFEDAEQKTATQLEHELAALRKAGPHPEGSTGHTKIRELLAAIKKAKKASVSESKQSTKPKPKPKKKSVKKKRSWQSDSFWDKNDGEWQKRSFWE